MPRRIIKFKSYRNLGIGGNENNYLIINNSLEKGKMGSLIEIIGANNSGKSNILDGIKAFSECKIQDRDITTLSYDDEEQKPEISLCVQGDKEIIKKVGLSGVSYDGDIDSESKVALTKEDYLEAANDLRRIISDHGCYTRVYDEVNTLINNLNNDRIDVLKESNELKKKILYYVSEIEKYLKAQGYNVSFDSYMHNKSKNFFSLLKKNKVIEDNFEEEYGFKLTPNVIMYTEEMINASDLETNIHKVKDSKFFNSLFKALEIKDTDILKAVELYEKHHNPSFLDEIEDTINKKMAKLNNRFNKLYFAESDKYKFKVRVESNLISFGMARGETNKPIMIEHQSTGFRWFFNLYFNFMCSNTLVRGDIVIMDEPATNLHPEGQRELRGFLKEFAKKNDITIIIATHVPFLIDPDNYEDIRVVTMVDNKAYIDNLFTAMNNNDPDTVLPIKDALTIKQNVLYDMDTEVIWVEGLTDYCYLTAFKNMLGYKNISFVPFNGVGKNDEDRDKILTKILSAKFYKRGILLDGDAAGKAMAKKCAGTAFDHHIYSISNLSEKFQEIEDLFTDNDKRKWNILRGKEIQKKAPNATILKNYAKKEDFEEETINNFTNLFESFL